MEAHLLVVAGVLAVVIGIFVWIAWPDSARLPLDAVTGPHPELGAPREQSIPTIGVADGVGWKDGEAPTPAAGLKVAAFARGLDHPRWLYRLPNGDVLVAESNSPPRAVGGITGMVMGWLFARAGAAVASANRITLLRDGNGDGVADQRFALLTGLNSPSGMALVGDQLYVANTDALVRFPYHLGDTRITARPELVVRLPGGGNHWARNVIYDPNYKKLFVSVGSSTNIAEDGLDAEKYRAAVWDVDPVTRNWRIFASGLRNPNGLAIEPRTGRLWAVVNERDQLGSDLPPDYLTEVEFGANYGWPWAYWGGFADHRVTPEQPDMLEYFKRPDYALGAHVAPLGLSFASDAKLGAKFAQGAFIGEHGSWNRKPLSGYKLVFVPFADSGYPAKGARPVDVLTGFLDPAGNTARGRPVGVVTDASGALLVADDVGNTIWRVSAR